MSDFLSIVILRNLLNKKKSVAQEYLVIQMKEFFSYYFKTFKKNCGMNKQFYLKIILSVNF